MAMKGSINFRGVEISNAYVVLDGVYRDEGNILGWANIFASEENTDDPAFGRVPVSCEYAAGDWMEMLEEACIAEGTFAGFVRV